ncbi:MAG: hypothetical protein KJ580_03490 [Nanoarchaeota archaeon]|nr:hypothetical protein [Nanoarchaeota archaeon]
MKKIFLSLIVCILMISLVLAQGQQGIHEPGTGIENPELKEAGQGTGQGQDNDQETGQGTGDSSEQEVGQGVQTNTETQQQNQGEETQIQNQIQTQSRVKSGSYTTENGKQLQIQEQSNNKVQLKSGKASAQTSMEMIKEQAQDKTKLKVKLSNGKNSEVKVMPDTASEKAMERLRMKVCSEENNCQIELKEVGQGEQVRAAYEVQAQKQAKFLGLFKTKMQVQAQVDAENGEVIRVNKPWWAFLASESEE